MVSAHTRWGALLWASSIQFFIAQVVVALGWDAPYNLAAVHPADRGCGSRALDRASLVMGILGLAGTILFVAGVLLGLGQGGLEWAAASPLTLRLTGMRLHRWRIGMQTNGKWVRSAGVTAG